MPTLPALLSQASSAADASSRTAGTVRGPELNGRAAGVGGALRRSDAVQAFGNSADPSQAEANSQAKKGNGGRGLRSDLI